MCFCSKFNFRTIQRIFIDFRLESVSKFENFDFSFTIFDFRWKHENGRKVIIIQTYQHQTSLYQRHYSIPRSKDCSLTF